MVELFAKSGDPNQMPHSAASDWVCTVCQLPFYGSPDYNGLMHYKRMITRITKQNRTYYEGLMKG